jgi:asparagine synthase (glutamine-hydrolysing)
MAFNRRVVDDYAGAQPLAHVLAHNFETYLPYDLLVKADRASMMHSLELRSPFLDTALIEFAARLPARYLRSRPLTKRILKRSFRTLIPKHVLSQPKRGFGIPLGSWFRNELREYLLDHFAPSAKMWSYLHRPYVDRIVRSHLEGQRDEGHRLWLLLTIEVWLRSLVETGGARSVAANVESHPAGAMG